jgi:hypothetical protein
MQQPVVEFHSPGVQQQQDDYGLSLSHYAGNSHVFPPKAGLRLPADFTDGTSNTILFGEVSSGFRPWGHPLNLRDPARGIRKSDDAFCGPWSNGVTFFAMADGSVRSVKSTISSATLIAAATPAAGDMLGPDW